MSTILKFYDFNEFPSLVPSKQLVMSVLKNKQRKQL